ncbi:TetR family transcriptional regulator [Achromobacter sp. 413638]|uniref:TetR family transcriptional regulator n=1 Tax=Achromobacter sp. 413638 TaxID=3342385 RepID=UPI00370A2F81
MARRKQGEAGATRDAVLDAAESGFRLRGGAHASVESIAAQAGWSRGAASYHFRGKAELLRAVLARGRLPLLQDLRRLALAPGPVVPALLACAQRWMEALQGDPHARNVFGILAWAYDYADDYAGIRRETLALGLREFRLLRGLLRRAEAAGELRQGLDGHECARLLAAWWLGAAASCVATPYRSGVAARPRYARSLRVLHALIARPDPADDAAPPANGAGAGRRKPVVRRTFFGGARAAPGTAPR